MKLRASSVAWLLPLLLTACLHKNRPRPFQALPPSTNATLKPEPVHIELPPSASAIHTQSLASDVLELPERAPEPPVRAKQPVSRNVQVAANASIGVSAIGLLTFGDPPAMRIETVDLIAATELGLSNIHRPLSKQEQKTAAQARKFLKKAKGALLNGDVDGAHTLAVKADILLNELTQ